MGDTITALKNTLGNIATLGKGMSKLPKLQEAIPPALEDTKITATKLKEDTTKFTDWAKEAHEKKLLTAYDVVKGMWP